MRHGDDTRMTVLVPNTDEEARRRLPAPGDRARVPTRSDETPHRQGGGRRRPRARTGGDPGHDSRRPPRAATLERLLRDPLTRRRPAQRAARPVPSARRHLAYLAACGARTGGVAQSGEQGPEEIAKTKLSDNLTFSNWPLYIEEDRGTLKEFEKEYGAKVKYVEEINDNTEFFGKVRQQYERGDSGGRDIHVVTDWMAARMIRLGYVQRFDPALTSLTAQQNLLDRLRNPRPSTRAATTPCRAVGLRRHRLSQGQGQAGTEERRRPLRSGLQGQGHDAHGNA